MPDENAVNIPITSSFDNSGTDAAAKSLQNLQAAEQAASKPVEAPVSAPGAEQVQAKLHALTGDADEFIATLKAGASLELGVKLAEGILELGAAFKEAVAEGVEYNKEIETSTLGIAAALRSIQPEKYLDFNAAREQASANLDLIREEANTLGLDFRSLEGAYSASLSSLIHGGVTDVGQQLELVSTLIAAAASKGVSGTRQLVDVIDILNGRADKIVLARELGLESEALKAAAANGTLYAEIIGKIGGYQEGLQAQSDTLGAIEQRTRNLVQQLEGGATVPVFDAIKDGLRELDEELAKPDVLNALRGIGYEVGEVVRTGTGLLNFAVQNAGALSVLAQGTAAYGAALIAVRIVDFVAALGTKAIALAADTAATIAATTAKAADTEATIADTGATAANTAAKLENAAASTAAAESGAAKSFSAGAGLAGSIGLSVAVGLFLKQQIDDVTASTIAATLASGKLGETFASQTKELQTQVQLADTAAKVAAVRTKIEDDLSAATARRANASEGERTLIDQQVMLLDRMLDTLDQTAGRVVKIKTTEEGRTKDLKEQQSLLDDQLATIDKVDKALVAQAKKDLKDLSPEELQSRITAQKLNAKALLDQGGVKVPVGFDLDNLDPSTITRLRDQLIAPLEAAAGATAKEKQAAQDSQEAYQALRAKISEVALDVANLGNAYESSSKKANAAASQAAKEQEKNDKALIKSRRDFIDALGQENAERGVLKTAQDALHTAQTATDKDSEAGQKRIKEAVKAVTKAQKDLQQAEKDRQDAAKKAFPDEVKRIQELIRLLQQMNPTGTPEQADLRAGMQNELKGLQNKVQSKTVTAPLSEEAKARILGLGDPTTGVGNVDAVPPEYADKPPGYANPGPVDPDAPYSTPPVDRDAAGDIVTSTSNTDAATGKLNDAAGKLADSTGKLPASVDSLKTGLDNYHAANLKGNADILAVVNKNTTGLEGQQSTIQRLSQRMDTLQLQIENFYS